MAAEAGGGGSSSSSQYLYIGGKIWIDEKMGKQEVYNDLYDSNTEQLYKQSVTVSLINSSGNTVKTDTTSNGSYSINTGISITSSTSKSSIANYLKGYYLKFEYNNKYTTVSPNFDKENGSKGLIKDGQDGVAYIYNLSDYVELFYEYQTLDHMNLGLIKVEDTQYKVTQNIAYVKVVVNGYTYKYEYGGSGDTTKTAAPTVNWQNSYAYTRAIYPSDIAYSKDNSNSIEVYVVYRIDINNTNKTNYGKKKSNTNKPVSYVEVDLKVDSLTNKYDTDRYELETEYDKSKNKDFGNWKQDNGVATYTGDKLTEGIIPGSPKTVYIQFKVKENEINKLLIQEEVYEKTPTIATVVAHHNYWKAYYDWDIYKEEHYLAFKDMKTEKYEETAEAYYLRLKINTERTITGRVFEDENIYTNGEHLGDGMYGSNENTISNVKVELISKDGNIAKLYSKDNNYEVKDALTTSAQNGTYSFVGVTPGKYYVRFTYGDGTQKIIKPDGTESGTVTIADYKSTIVTESCVQSGLGYGLNDLISDKQWYKHTSSCNTPTIYSTAVDNLAQRAQYNKDKTSRNNIEANTALMDIGVENTEENIATVTKTFEEDIVKETVLGINFGIIDIPEVSLAFDKVVSNIQIINTQGNVIAEGNPASKNVKYVNDLDESPHIVEGSQYTKSEIKEQELYGSTLRLTYSITIQNNSEVNYYEDIDKDNKYYGYYYKFGDNTTDYSKEVTITVDNVLDFIDPLIKYENISIKEQHIISKEEAVHNQVLADNVTNNITSLNYEYLVDITNWKELYTTQNREKNYSQDKTQDTAELTVTKLLSNNDDDLGVSNVAQVTKLHVTNTPALIEKIEASSIYFNNSEHLNPTEEVYVMITPPTGENRITPIIYVVTGLISLSVISIGVIFIKKKVLDK